MRRDCCKKSLYFQGVLKMLPVDSLKGKLVKLIDGGCKRFAVAAPTGSGKSTRLPVMLAEKLGGRILVLQPRRVAARMLAKGVAALYGANTGWHVRFDRRYDDSTQIVFLTEGILARMLLEDPSLKGVSAIVFDEFHERNIYADVSLALALRSQETIRGDMVLAVCSASMDSAALVEYLGVGAEKLECDSRLFPIDIRYSPPKDRNMPVWDCAAREFERLARESDSGNFLVFMPGVYEISKTVSRISASPMSKGFEVYALHGDLEPHAQDKILSKSPGRKVIVSTNVAETSLTIEGVKYVIDSGLAKVARFDPARGVNTLLVERVSLASAIQRAGRAGRTSSGVAVRLWRQNDEISFAKYNTPEISRLDLSQIILWLCSRGLKIDDLKLFEKPPIESAARAENTLQSLGAMDSLGNVTKVGTAMAAFPTEPRYAKLLIEGAKRGCIGETAMIAAMMDVGKIKLPISDTYKNVEREAMLADAHSEPEGILRLCALAKANSFSDSFCRTYGIHAANARKAFAIAADLERLARRRLKPEAENMKNGAMAKCILGAFSDHLAVRLNKGTLACRMAGGRRAEIARDSRQYASDIFVSLDVQERNVAGGVSIMLSLIAPVSADDLREMFPGDFSESAVTALDSRNKRVVGRTKTMFRDLLISESDTAKVSPDEAAKILRDEILAGRLELKDMDEDARYFIERVNFAAAVCPESGIQPIDDAAKSEIFEQMCFGCLSFSDVKALDAKAALRDWLSYEQQCLLKYLVPKSAEFPRRKKPVRIRYEISPPRAIVSAFFRDFYDFDEKKIKICDGKIRPTFEILSPGGRAVQTTQNLEEFWKTSWIDVKKELKARYPKHFKPGDPH